MQVLKRLERIQIFSWSFNNIFKIIKMVNNSQARINIVYEIEKLLEQMYALLHRFGFYRENHARKRYLIAFPWHNISFSSSVSALVSAKYCRYVP